MSETFKIIIGQAFGIIAPIITFASYQFNTKRSLMITQTLATLFNCLSYLFLGATAGFALNIVCILRNVTYYFQKSHSKFAFPSSIVFAAAMCVLGVFSWQGPVSLLMIIALAINTVVMSLGIPQLLRKSILLTSSMIFIYNIFFIAVGGMINEGIAIVSSIIGIVRFRASRECGDGKSVSIPLE